MSPKAVETTATLHDSEWQVSRRARLEEVLMDDGSFRFHLTIQDMGRAPFIDQWFSSDEKARNLLDKVKANAT